MRADDALCGEPVVVSLDETLDLLAVGQVDAGVKRGDREQLGRAHASGSDAAYPAELHLDARWRVLTELLWYPEHHELIAGFV